MSETKVLCESFPRTNSSGSISNINSQDCSDSNRNAQSPTHPVDNLENSKSRSYFLDNLDRDHRPPRDLHVHRRNSSHGLDLSKQPPALGESNGLDLSKSELISPNNSFVRSSETVPLTNGIPSDTQPTPAPVSYAPGRSHSVGEAISPFRADPVPNGYSPDNLTNGGDYKTSFLEPYNKSMESTSTRFTEGYSTKAFDPITTSPGLMTATAGSPTYATKISDSYMAAKLAESSQFPKSHDPFSKILEDYGNNARNNNNNNNISESKLIDDYTDIYGKRSDSPYKKIAESYVKQIESLTNGYKTDSTIFKHENSLSPESFKAEPPTFGNLPKSDSNLTNGNNYNNKADSVSSSSQPPSQSLPSIINFSTNHFRGIAAVESGLAGYLNSYGVGGTAAERGERGGGGGGREGQSGGGGGGNDSSISRTSPNNKLACRFCGKTFSQAGYIKAHERLHTGEKPFACSVCGKRFSDPSNWKKHERVHANNKKPATLMESHESKAKNFFMKSMASLMTSSLQHRLSIRPDPGGPIMCKICGKMFSSQSSLSTHKRIHTGERPYRCSSCGKCFTQIGTLRTHERIHTGEKPYICKVCGRTFAQSGSYRMHERRHMTDSIQRCHICYATFTTWQDLQRHMASHPQVTQAILEFEEGNQGIITRPNPGDLGGQLGDGSIGQLGQPDMDGQGHGHVLLQGDCGGQRDLAVHHARCPHPLIPESLLLESDPTGFHVQPQGLYHSPGQLPPFSSILPFRHHPGGPPTFPPSFPPGLGLLGPQSLPVTSHADLLTKHPFFGAMIGASQLKHDALTKLSPTYSPQHQMQQHHLLHQQQHQQPRNDHQQQPQCEHSINDGTDVVSTTSATKRADMAQRNSSRSYTPEERSDTETLTHLKDSKEGMTFTRSVSSDEGLHSPDDNNMETNGDEEMMGHDHEMAENDNEDDTDVEDRSYPSERGYSSARRFTDDGERRGGDREGDNERGGFSARHRSRSFEGGPDKERRDFKKERNHSGEITNKNSNCSRGRDFDYEELDRKRGYDHDRGYETKSGRNNRGIINRYMQGSSDNGGSREKNENKSTSLSGTSNSNNNGGDERSNNNNENSDLRPPKRHIERQNLNTRMIPSSSSRKQRHPMRRFSSAGSEQESPQSTSSLPVSSTTAEAIERGDLDDNDLVTFLLTKGRVHKCVHCHMIFEDASLFLLHNGFHSHDDPFRCVVCSTACKDRIDFNCHLTSHIK